jgi:hypothetical protein
MSNYELSIIRNAKLPPYEKCLLFIIQSYGEESGVIHYPGSRAVIYEIDLPEWFVISTLKWFQISGILQRIDEVSRWEDEGTLTIDYAAIPQRSRLDDPGRPQENS